MTAKRLLKRTEATLLILGALASAACESDTAPGAGGNGGENNGNGNNNGSVDLDGGLDASMSKPDEDASSSTGGPIVTDSGLTLECDLEPEQLAIEIDKRGSHTWDALQIGETIHLVYEIPTCPTEVQVQAQRLDYLTFKSTGEFGKGEPIVNGGDGVCQWTRTPTLSPSMSGKPLLYYTTNATISGNSELYQREIGSDEPPVQLAAYGSDPGVESTVASSFGEGKNLIAYVKAYSEIMGPPPTSSAVVTRRPGLPERELFPQQSKVHVSSLALAEFPAADALGGVLAWVVDVASPPGITLQPLDKAGDASGDSHELTQAVGSASSVSIAILPKGEDDEFAGAVVYSVAPDDLHAEIRFRTLAHDGSIGPEVSITKGNRNAHSPSIVPFLDGYVMAFRNVDGAATSINVAFLNQSGNMAEFGERTLIGARPSGEGGPPKVFVTNDARISVVFTDTDNTATTLRAVRAICDP